MMGSGRLANRRQVDSERPRIARIARRTSATGREFLMLRVLCPFSHRFMHMASMDEAGRRMRRPASRAKSSLARVATLLMLALGWVSSAHAQANIALGAGGVTGASATNTSWSIAKNASTTSDTPTRHVALPNHQLSEQIIQDDGQFSTLNLGTTPA